MKIKKEHTPVILGVAILGMLIAAAFLIEDKKDSEVDKVRRGEEGSGTQEEVLKYETEDGGTGQITIEIPEKILSEEEAEERLEEAAEKIRERMLLPNTSFQRIEYDMELPISLENIPVQIAWQSSDANILNSRGEIGEAATEEGTEVLLTAEISLQNLVYRLEQRLKVYKRRALNMKEELLEAIKTANQTEDTDYVLLPESVGGRKLAWFVKPDRKLVSLLFVAMIVILMLTVKKRQDKEDEKSRRLEEMTEDYPEVVSKFLLLSGAGLSIRSCFLRIAKDYRREKEAAGRHRYIYEEIAICSHEIESGISELRAYDNFGKRIPLNSYRTMALLLSQSIKKGSRGILEQLEREAIASFSDRKRRAKIKGEKAATKLLVPMAMMLFVVLVIIMVPAYLSFSL